MSLEGVKGNAEIVILGRGEEKTCVKLFKRTIRILVAEVELYIDLAGIDFFELWNKN